MLDPLTALSVAGNIIQFIDFGSKLLSKGYELYQSADGASVGNSELERIARDLQLFNDRLQQSQPSLQHSTPPSDSDKALGKLSEQCSAIAGELIAILDTLKVQGTSNRRWKSFRQALKGLMKKGDVNAIMTRLQRCRDELNLRILVSMRDTLDMQSIKQTEGFRSLDTVAKGLVTRLELEQREIQKALADHTKRITGGQNRTNELVTKENEKTRRSILASLRQSRMNRSPHRPSGGTESNGDAIQKDRLVESVILSSLSFPRMTNRYEEIEVAHRQTYEWIFQSPKSHHSTNFSTWLAEGEGIYWINGKAASGKSTLMRFVYGDSRTRNILKRWSQEDNLVITSHFLWNSGTKDQRSHTGLLRAVLHNILLQCTNMIRLVFPKEWDECQKLPSKLIKKSMIQSWTLSRLSRGWEVLFLEATETKFCIFIDGLDEYDGDPEDIIKLFTGLSKFPNVKVCVSSRPLYDFVTAFRSFPHLRLQDLTFNDIKLYVDDELGANSRMKELKRREPIAAPKLVLEIVERADGVFLWVKLVVTSLLRGLRNSDQISDLQRRLLLLPPSLEALFSLILQRVEPVYRQQSSRIFQIFATAQRVEHPLTSHELSFAEENNIEMLLLLGTTRISSEEASSRRDVVEIWLQTRCGGLIELHSDRSLTEYNRSLSYLHRTVRDFLELRHIWSLVLEPTMGCDFNANRSLLKSTILYLNFVVLPKHNLFANYAELNTPSHQIGYTPLRFAFWGLAREYEAELETGKANVPLLEALEKSLIRCLDISNDWIADNIRQLWAQEDEDGHDYAFLILAIRFGLYPYVSRRLDQEPQVVTKRFDGTTLITEVRVTSKMIALLFSHGAQPDQEYEGQTAWQMFLVRVPGLALKGYDSQYEALKIMRIFLENGADPEQPLQQVRKSTPTIKDLIDECFKDEFPEETEDLQDLLASLIRTARKRNVSTTN